MIRINDWTRGWNEGGRISFGGGYPKMHYIPRFVRWGPYLSIFFLDTELVIRINK